MVRSQQHWLTSAFPTHLDNISASVGFQGGHFTRRSLTDLQLFWFQLTPYNYVLPWWKYLFIDCYILHQIGLIICYNLPQQCWKQIQHNNNIQQLIVWLNDRATKKVHVRCIIRDSLKYNLTINKQIHKQKHTNTNNSIIKLQKN